MSGIFWILFLLFVKSIQPTACFKCVNTQRGVVEQKHHYFFFFFCQTVVTDVRIFKRKEEESQKKYVALLVFEMIQQTRRARYFLHFISFKRVSVLPFYPISSSQSFCDRWGKERQHFPLARSECGAWSIIKGTSASNSQQNAQTYNKKTLKMMSENYESQSTENWALEDKPPSALHPPLPSINWKWAFECFEERPM